jgi:RNA polymerase sigma-70 factor (ECF subfamily)
MDATTPDFEHLVAELRPMLHRYCARMTGSVIDGEDVVQDALLKAFSARGSVETIDNPRAWLVRIAHNTSLDFLRRRARESIIDSDDAIEMIAAPEAHDPDAVSASLHSFMALPALQRAAVILKDVLDHSLDEVASITGMTPAAAKSALQRGRERLRAISREPAEQRLPTLDEATRTRLTAYVDGFASGDFDTVRAMIAEDVQLDLVGRFRERGGPRVRGYFTRYAEVSHWHYRAGIVERRPAMLVYDRRTSLDTPVYFVTIEFNGDRVVDIRDFLFAPYAMENVELYPLSRTL